MPTTIETAAKGITPACAGISRFPYVVPGLNRDHPRVRGDKVVALVSAIRWAGSPPRARG